MNEVEIPVVAIGKENCHQAAMVIPFQYETEATTIVQQTLHVTESLCRVLIVCRSGSSL